MCKKILLRSGSASEVKLLIDRSRIDRDGSALRPVGRVRFADPMEPTGVEYVALRYRVLPAGALATWNCWVTPPDRALGVSRSGGRRE
eukprot:5739656-Prymnesium_polylepis.1